MNFLKEARKNAGLTQAEVAKKAGIKQPTYCNIENSERKPSVEMAKRIGETLGFPWTRFFEEEDRESA